MVAAHQNLNGLRDLTTPLSGTDVIRGLALAAMIPNLKSLTPLTAKMRKVIQISKKGWFWVATGHSRSLEIAPCDRARTSSYWRSVVTMSLSCSICEI